MNPPGEGRPPTDKNTNSPGGGLWWCLRWVLRGGWIDADRVAARYEMPGVAGWVLALRPLYVALGVVGCFGVGGSMSMAELGWSGAFVAMVVGLAAHGRIVAGVLEQPVVLLLMAWGLWMGANLARSPDGAKAIHEIGSMRFAVLVPVLAPLLPERRLLIGGLAAGLLAGNAAQGVVALARLTEGAGEWAWRYAPRNAGWWGHPAIAGYMLLAGLGLHLPAAWMGRGRARWLGVIGVVVTWGGIVATGTRGAWLAGAALTAVVGGLALWRLARRGQARSAIWMLAVVVVAAGLGVAAAWPIVGPRMRETRDEVRRALVEGDLSTYSGSRVQYARWAWEMWRERPLTGHGPGSYEWWVRARIEATGRAVNVDHIAPQAHNLVLHAGATLGIVGVAIMAGVAWFAVRGALDAVPRAAGGEREWGTYGAGPLFALVGMLLCEPFEVLYVHSPPSAVLGVLVAVSLFAGPRGVRPGVPTLGPWRRSGNS